MSPEELSGLILPVGGGEAVSLLVRNHQRAGVISGGHDLGLAGGKRGVGPLK
jgi:hypothetical protein